VNTKEDNSVPESKIHAGILKESHLDDCDVLGLAVGQHSNNGGGVLD